MPAYTDKVALVTGASSGLGRGIAVELGRLGAFVLLVGREPSRLQSTNSEVLSVGGRAKCLICDLVNESQIKILTETVRSTVDTLDLLVNCAGKELLAPVQAQNPRAVRDLFDVNFHSVFLITRCMLPLLKRGAAVVNIGSAASQRGEAGLATYAATKAAVTAFSRCLAAELSGRGIRVNVVAPGMVRSQMASRMMARITDAQAALVAKRHLLGLGEIEDVARAVAFLGSDEAKWITGQEFTVDGGFSL